MRYSMNGANRDAVQFIEGGFAGSNAVKQSSPRTAIIGHPSRHAQTFRADATSTGDVGQVA
jgi:hypothetical protein